MVSNFFIDELAPCYCLLCKLPSQRPIPLCRACELELPSNQHPCQVCALDLASPDLICMDCQRQARSFTHCVAPWLYGKPISTFLKQFKFTADMHVLPLLSHLLVNAVRQDIETHGAPDLVLPVPIHWWRLVRRGFNHAELLAKDLSSHPSIHPCQLQVKPSWCKKIRLTAAQHDLGLAQRKSNLAGVFSCDDRVAGLSVAIVDDVITTGATAENVSCALLAAGAQQVRVWCLARTPNPS